MTDSKATGYDLYEVFGEQLHMLLGNTHDESDEELTSEISRTIALRHEYGCK